MTLLNKKSAVLAMAAAFSGVAFAQSNVTVYGVVDVGYAYTSGDRAGGGSSNFSGIAPNLLGGSRIGFKGEEGLGNGLKAVFVLEYALDPDVNSGIGGTSNTSRQSYIGLNSTSFGTVALGRQYAPGYAASGRNNPFGGSTRQSPLNRLTGANTITGDGAARISNSISYASPKWNGFSVNAIYGFGESLSAPGVSTSDNGFFGAGLNYANGPLNLDLVFQQRRDVQTTAAPAGTTHWSLPGGVVATGDDINEWAVMGSYDLKVVKLFASYQAMDDKNGTSANEGSNKIWSAGVNVPVFGNGSIQLAYAKADWDRTNAGSTDGWAIGYRHSLSKRTTLYTTYGVLDNDDRLPRYASWGVGSSGALGGNLGGKVSIFTAGINHSF
ncbi:MAG: porin [Rhodocyclaceae bacterium]|nr:porin [Rhodocyclaceae bacterium]